MVSCLMPDVHHDATSSFALFGNSGGADSSAAAGAHVGDFKVTGKAGIVPATSDHTNDHLRYNSFRQYTWTATSPFQKLMREAWKYLQSIEDEHYHIYYKRSVNEETLKDYSSAIQELIPRLAKIQTILNENSRGFHPSMTWEAPTGEPIDVKHSVHEGAQSCKEFGIMSEAALQKGPISDMAAGAMIQDALACQAAASKVAVALQREKFGDPTCDPKTVIDMSSGDFLTTIGVCLRSHREERSVNILHFL